MKVIKIAKAFLLVTLISLPASLFADQGVSDDEILIGSHTALSGPAAIWGVSAVNAIRLHFKEVNESGGIHGRKIRLIAEDHGYQVPRAIQAGNKLLNRDKVFAMLASVGTPMNNAVLPKQLAKNVPNVFPYSPARSMVEPFHRLKFSAVSSYYDQVRSAVKYFVETKGKKAVCLMYQGTDYGQEVLEGANEQLKAMGMKLTDSASHKPTDTDFVTGVMKMRKSGCDLVLTGTIIGDTIRIIATARKLGWNVDFVGNVASYDQIVIAKSGGALEGYYVTTSNEMVYEDTAEGEAKTFFKQYKQSYEKTPSSSAQLAYSFARLMTHAMKKAGRNLTVDSFVSAMESIRNYKSPFGGPLRNLSASNHQAVRQVLLSQVQKDRWVTVSGPLSY